MLRNCVAFLIALYAIGFAFAALAAVRWPTLLMLAAVFGDNASALNAQINWQELGLVYGLIYLVSGYFFYTASSLISSRRRGSILSYIAGVGIGFPPFLIFYFDAGWWQDPDTYEQIVLFAGVLSIFLFGLILELNRTRQQNRTPEAVEGLNSSMGEPILLTRPVVFVPAEPVLPKPRRRKPVPAAIMRQRQSFAQHGRKMHARRRR